MRAIWTVALFALPIVDARASSSTEAVTDEKLRQAALRAVFPQMKVSWSKKSTKPERPFHPDALSGEAVYLVAGRAANIGLRRSRDRAERAKRFRVTKTTYFEKGAWFSKPRVSYDFYERGAGVDKESAEDRQQMLAQFK